MDRLEILVEEPSIKEVLAVVLPQILPQGWVYEENWFIRKHNGKSDLRRSIPIKFRAFSQSSQNVGILIVQDQDANDCVKLKQELVELCQSNNTKPCPYLVRIVCHELEAWYFGDPDAIEQVFGHKFKADAYRNKSICKKPDDVITPKKRLKSIVGDYPQVATAKEIGIHMDVDSNSSESFNQLKRGILSLIEQ